TALPPAFVISFTTSCAGPTSLPLPSKPPPRSLTTTAAPCLARRSASSRPIPRPAPVTSATLPSSKPIVKILLLFRVFSLNNRAFLPQCRRASQDWTKEGSRSLFTKACADLTSPVLPASGPCASSRLWQEAVDRHWESLPRQSAPADRPRRRPCPRRRRRLCSRGSGPTSTSTHDPGWMPYGPSADSRAIVPP